MHSHQVTDYVSPHTHPEKKFIRYLEWLMRLTYDHPLLMRDLLYVAGASSLALTFSPLIFPLLGYAAPLATGTAVLSGVGATLFSAANLFAQHRIFGFPVPADFQAYQPAYFVLGDHQGSGEMIIQPGQMPLLRIKAKNYYAAGYIEGLMLAPALHDILSKMDVISWLVSVVYGTSDKSADWPLKLQDVLRYAPEQYLEEMKGKVEGYNHWRAAFYPNQPPLSLEKYFILQLLPDLRNFNLFPHHEKLNKLMTMFDGIGCTTFVLRLHDQTFYNRVLDWPAHDAAGKYIYQQETMIANVKSICDVRIPPVSGALTAVNQDGLLIQINVAHGPKIAAACGMPAIFFNRFCAEQASNVEGIDEILKTRQPLGAYHLTASTGEQTKSFHFYQGKEREGVHATETLNGISDDIQLLVVANQGVRFRKNIPHVKNHRDSRQRMENLVGFFHHETTYAELKRYLQHMQNGVPLTDEMAQRITAICHQAAKLPLVNNMESVLFAQYHFDGKKLRSARAAADNLFAPERKPEEFQQLKI